MIIDRGLIVYEKYARMIVRGLKTWELRSYRTRIRGPIAIISGSHVYGIVDLYDIDGPYKAKDLIEYFEYHRVKPEVLLNRFKDKDVRIRKMMPIIRFEKPIPIGLKRGARIRVRINLEINNI